MANVLDLRRRIRSVKSTRQITKAMKMIAAAKLRRAQERAMSGRPYASMLASVIGSLMRHIDLYDPSTGNVRHPLLLAREEKEALLIVVSGDKGFAGGFNGKIGRASCRERVFRRVLFRSRPETCGIRCCWHARRRRRC